MSSEKRDNKNTSCCLFCCVLFLIKVSENQEHLFFLVLDIGIGQCIDQSKTKLVYLLFEYNETKNKQYFRLTEFCFLVLVLAVYDYEKKTNI